LLCNTLHGTQSNQKSKGQRINAAQLEKFIERAQNQQIELMRFLPMLHETMVELVQGKLTTSGTYIYVHEIVSASINMLKPKTQSARVVDAHC
jgi:hypothetical protein